MAINIKSDNKIMQDDKNVQNDKHKNRKWQQRKNTWKGIIKNDKENTTWQKRVKMTGEMENWWNNIKYLLSHWPNTTDPLDSRV